MRRDSLFRISSTTKPITGAATMALVDEGLLALDAPVEDLLPEVASPRVLRQMDGPLSDTVPAHRAITVRDLLTFTFGFGMHVSMFASETPWPIAAAAADAELATLGPPEPSVAPAADEWIKRLGSLPLMAQPGERWLYSTGAQVLGVLCQRAAGTSTYEEVLRTRIFEPLGMTNTSFVASDVSRLATAYADGEGGLTVWDPPDGKWANEPAFEDGAGGLVSTADDLLAFARMFTADGSTALSPESRAAMTSDQLTPSQREGQEGFLDDRSWGLCQSVLVTGERAGAFGWEGGLGSTFLIDPVRDLVIVVLAQRMMGSAEAFAVHNEIQAAAYDALR